MSVAEQTLPRWDMTSIYPGLGSPEFERDFRSVAVAIEELTELFDRYQIEEQDQVPVDQTTIETFETVHTRYSLVSELLGTLDAYIYSFITTDSRDELARAKSSELEQTSADLTQLSTRLTAWVGSLSDLDHLMAQSEIARRHAHLLKQAKIEATHLMSPAEEELAIELDLTGGSAWTKLQETISSQLLVPVDLDGETKVLAMSDVSNMAYDRDREKRRLAHHAKLRAWEQVAVPMAAALNSIKGQTNTLVDRRGWESALDLALFQNAIDHSSLTAMIAGVREFLPDMHRYLRAKARALDIPALAWYDVNAPVGSSTREWPFDEARAFIDQQFGTYSTKLSNFAKRAFSARWIDAEPREGKEDGAFCMPVRDDESRILANYAPSYNAVSTLVHELGHAYHNAARASRPILLRSTPNTLAETASIFCEALVREAALAQADPAEQVLVLEASLQEACINIVDVLTSFLFEERLFERRRERELSVDELKQLAVEAQREVYADSLDPAELHPFEWASDSLYYSADGPFYNFPYTFGLLFALGLYARYRHDPETFKPDYDELLASTGEADAATLCARFGIDIRQPDFWRESLDILRRDIDRFESLVDAGAASEGGKAGKS